MRCVVGRSGGEQAGCVCDSAYRIIAVLSGKPPMRSHHGSERYVGTNTYSATADKLSFNPNCKQRGWKGVQARAVWTGMLGFVESGCCAGVLDNPQSKYTSIDIENSASISSSRVYSWNGSAPPFPREEGGDSAGTYSESFTSSVDAYGECYERWLSKLVLPFSHNNQKDGTGATVTETIDKSSGCTALNLSRFQPSILRHAGFGLSESDRQLRKCDSGI